MPVDEALAVRAVAAAESTPQSLEEQLGDLRLYELISWSVQEQFSDNPFSGWIEDINCAYMSIPTYRTPRQRLSGMYGRSSPQRGFACEGTTRSLQMEYGTRLSRWDSRGA